MANTSQSTTLENEVDESTPKGFWFILCGLTIISFLTYGCCASVIGFIIEPLRADLNESVEKISFIPALIVLIPGLATPITNPLIDRFGAKIIIGLGALICAIGYVIASSSHTFIIVLSGFLVVGIGLSLCSVYACIIVISRWTSSKIAFASGVFYAACSAGACISPFLINDIVQRHGWRGEAYASALMFILIVVPVAIIFAKNPPLLLQSQVKEEKIVINKLELAKDIQYWMVCLIECLFSLSLIGSFIYAPSYLAGLGYSDNEISIIFGAANIISIFGSLIIGKAAEKWGSVKVAIIGLLANGLALLVSQKSGTDFTGIICISFFTLVWGLTLNIGFQLSPSMLFEKYEGVKANSLYVFSRPIVAVAMALAPLAAGQAYNIMGSFNGTFYVAAVFVMLSLIPSLILLRKPGMANVRSSV